MRSTLSISTSSDESSDRVAVGDDEVGGAEHALAEGLGVERANGRVGAAGHEGDVAVDLAIRIALDQLAVEDAHVEVHQVEDKVGLFEYSYGPSMALTRRGAARASASTQTRRAS